MQAVTNITLTAKQRNKIQRAVNALEAVRLEVSEQNDGHIINWYLEDTANLCLMDGWPHDDSLRQLQGMVINVFDLPMASGGAW